MCLFLHRCVGATTSSPFSVASVLALDRGGRSSASKPFGRTERASSTLVMSRKAVRVRSSALLFRTDIRNTHNQPLRSERRSPAKCATDVPRERKRTRRVPSITLRKPKAVPRGLSLSQLRSGRVAALRRASRWLRLVEDRPGALPHARQHVRTRAEAGDALRQVLCNRCARVGCAAPVVLYRLVDEEADHV